MKSSTRIGVSILGLALIALVAPAYASEAHRATIGDWGVDLTGRDPATPAGEDFFRYANGAWLDEFEIPDDLPIYGSFMQLYLDAEEQVRAIIEDAAAMDAPEGSSARKIGDLFNDYIDDEARAAAGLTPLAEDFAMVRAAGTHEEIAALLARYDRFGGTTPFNFYIDQDEKDPSRYLAHFFQSGLGLPDRDYYLDATNPRFVNALEVYREYLETLFTLAEQSDPAARAAGVIAMETRLAEAHWPSEETRDIDKTYNKMTKAEVRELAPDFPWNPFWNDLGLEETGEFIIMMPSAFAGMATVFADTPVELWQDWIIYRLLRNNAAFLPEAVDDAHFRFTSQAITGAKEKRDRWKRGVQFVNGTIGEAVGKIYVERHFSADAKRRIDELVANLLVAMGDRIDGLEWMSEETKAEARDKLSKFVVKIGYPSKWKDYSSLEVVRGDLFGNARRAMAFTHDYEVGKLGKPVDREEWFMSPQVVNAYYNAPMNEIVFPAAILQPPFFDPYADDAVNYGGIGAVIGHEIGHGFDDQGRKSDGDGVLRDWWTEEDARRFQTRADLLVEQYDGYSPIEGMNINGRLTLGENIGDLGGVEIALRAYELSLDGKEAPVIDGLTGMQRFFLGFAQIWRGKIRDELMANILASNPHSPDEFRVNGSVRNVDAWYLAFGVGPGDEMYLEPSRRVRIW